MAKELKDLTKRADNYSQWYNDLVVKADLAEQSAVRGCMVIKPYGYAIWEKMQQQLDKMFKDSSARKPSMLKVSQRNVLLSPTIVFVQRKTRVVWRLTLQPVLMKN